MHQHVNYAPPFIMISALSLSLALLACTSPTHPTATTVAPTVAATVANPASPASRQVAAPSSSPTAKPTAKLMSEITLSNADQGKTLTLKPGQKIILRLAENPTTGYRWSLPNLTSQVLQLTSDRFEQPNTPAMGTGGQRILTFQAHQVGQVNLTLKNRREWENEASAVESFQITIQVAE